VLKRLPKQKQTLQKGLNKSGSCTSSTAFLFSICFLAIASCSFAFSSIMPRSLSLIAMALLYIVAGINHFWHPATYIRIIPDYFPAKDVLNLLAGVAEIALGILLFPTASRRWAALLIIAMLVVFLPVHIWMIQKGGCAFGPRCIPDWLLWVRLLIGQPLLILWAWSNRK
jgi:uncharacterized membrane protein